MYIDKEPFPYLSQEQFVGNAVGDIVYFEGTVPMDKREWLKKEYKKWWTEQEKAQFDTNRGD